MLSIAALVTAGMWQILCAWLLGNTGISKSNQNTQQLDESCHGVSLQAELDML